MKKVGFVGLGQMGKWMASSIAKQGFDITVFDIDSLAMEFPVNQGAIPAKSLSDVARASAVVILSLPNADVCDNVIYNANIASLAEILPMAVKLGLDPESIADVINSGSGRSFASEYFIPKMLEGRFREAYSLGNAYKDMQHMKEAAARLDIFLPNFRSTLATYGKALEHGLENEDKGAMIKVFEKELAVLFRKGTGSRQVSSPAESNINGRFP
jgi:3-hydroxyisobutyrate dehydrogenase-like beta-hydroxyacid dehydrogenase